MSNATEVAVEHHGTVRVDEPYTGVIRLGMPKLNRHPEFGGWALELWPDEALELAAALVRAVTNTVRAERERGPA